MKKPRRRKKRESKTSKAKTMPLPFQAITNKDARLDHPGSGNFETVEQGTTITVDKEGATFSDISEVDGKVNRGVMAKADYNRTPGGTGAAAIASVKPSGKR